MLFVNMKNIQSSLQHGPSKISLDLSNDQPVIPPLDSETGKAKTLAALPEAPALLYSFLGHLCPTCFTCKGKC